MAEQLRGLVLPSESAEHIQVPAKNLFHVAEQAELAVAAYASLGMIGDKGATLDDFTKRFQAYQNSLCGEYRADEPTLEPFIGLELTDTFGLMALKSAFDKRQTTETHIDHPIWDQVSLTEANRRRLADDSTEEVPEKTGFYGQALAMVLGGDRADAPGLYFTNQNLETQITSVKADQSEYDASHVWTCRLLTNPADTIVVNAQRREAGQQLLDNYTLHRFVQIALKTAHGGSWVSHAYSREGRLGFYRSRGGVYPRAGVRLLVGQVAEVA